MKRSIDIDNTNNNNMTYNRIDKELDAPLQLRLQNSCKSKVFTFSLLFTLNTIIVPPPLRPQLPNAIRAEKMGLS